MADEWADFRVPADEWAEFRTGVAPATTEGLTAKAKAAGLSEDEIKRNYAINFSKTPEAAEPNWGLGVLGAHAQGIPVAGALVPDLPSIDWLKREHPNVAAAANMTGAITGAVPAFAAAPGAVGMTAVGAGLNAADTAARQYMDKGTVDPRQVAKSAAVGGAAANLPRVITPFLKSSPQISEGLDHFLTKAGGFLLGSAAGKYIPFVGGEGGIAGLLMGEQPVINKWLANKALAGYPKQETTQAMVNALGRDINNKLNP